MARYQTNTSLGGQTRGFTTTDWSQIHRAQQGPEPRRRQMINHLIARYWKPVYCYLRKKGCDNELAKDLTQGFFCDIVLKGTLIQNSDKAKGRFRNFLLTALQHYLSNYRDEQSAQKRRPPGRLVSWEDLEDPDLPAQEDLDADESYVYAWTADMLDHVLDELRHYYSRQDKESHWRIFYARVVEPITEAVKAPCLKEVAKTYGLAGEEKAAAIVATVKRRFRRILERHIQQSLSTPSPAREEIRMLQELLAKNVAQKKHGKRKKNDLGPPQPCPD